tara:strand:- start:956 stop:2677 length:1722 start_codon:yes stop_codon:yes gene_type:complete
MINFKTVTFKNFGSFGNTPTTIELDRHNMTLVSGSNGHGKSFALLDSITFGLFGKPFRKINIPQLVNSINQKRCEVEVIFEIGKDTYRVFRSLKPKKFEIYKNNKLLDQNAKSKDYQRMLEEQILKMNYKSFTQVVILGSSSFVPFMQLSAFDRRSVIEDILDINIFSTMNLILKTRVAACKEDHKDVVFRLELIKEKMSLLEKHIKQAKDKSDNTIRLNKEEIENTQSKIDTYQGKIEDDRVVVNDLQKQIKTFGNTKEKIHKIQVLRNQLESNLRKNEEKILFFEKNEVCPTCSQSIDTDNEIVQKTIDRKRQKTIEINKAMEELEEHYKTVSDEIKEVEKLLDDISVTETEISRTNGLVTAANDYMSKLIETNKKLTLDESLTKEESDKLESLKKDQEDLNKEKLELVEDQHYCSIASNLLKDGGIKSKIIKHYLPVINKLINKYLSSMDFFVQFSLDEEFNESIKSRHRDDFSYMSFSEGEKMRIDLALLLAWREIARIKNSANTNLLILDEVFDSSLDSFGTEEFLKLLHTLSLKCNMFIISHKSDQLSDKFENQMTFEKKNNFSGIK